MTVIAYQNNGEILTKGKQNVVKVIDTSYHGRVVVTEDEPPRLRTRRRLPGEHLQNPHGNPQVIRLNPRTNAIHDDNAPLEQSFIEMRINLRSRNENGLNNPRVNTRASHASGLRTPIGRQLNQPETRRNVNRVQLSPLLPSPYQVPLIHSTLSPQTGNPFITREGNC